MEMSAYQVQPSVIPVKTSGERRDEPLDLKLGPGRAHFGYEKKPQSGNSHHPQSQQSIAPPNVVSFVNHPKESNPEDEKPAAPHLVPVQYTAKKEEEKKEEKLKSGRRYPIEEIEGDRNDERQASELQGSPELNAAPIQDLLSERQEHEGETEARPEEAEVQLEGEANPFELAQGSSEEEARPHPEP
jgi:hypothetical protein